jgi:hypothetical protein
MTQQEYYSFLKYPNLKPTNIHQPKKIRYIVINEENIFKKIKKVDL